jgi:Uma2 family endonuclease
MVAFAALPVHMSVAEFLAWAPGTRERWQLVDGVPCAMAPASLTHGALQAELSGLIRDHLRARGSPCRIVGAPGVVPRVLAEHNMRVPDLAVTCTPPARDEFAMTEPVLIIEILSPSNPSQTWSNVWAYTSIPSVIEIVVIRSDRIAASLLRRQPDGTWPDRPAEIESGPLSLASIDAVVDMSDIYATTRLAG